MNSRVFLKDGIVHLKQFDKTLHLNKILNVNFTFNTTFFTQKDRYFMRIQYKEKWVEEGDDLWLLGPIDPLFFIL